MHRVAVQGMRAKDQPQAAPGALGRGLTALEIQKFILGQTKVPHEGKQFTAPGGSGQRQA